MASVTPWLSQLDDSTSAPTERSIEDDRLYYRKRAADHEQLAKTAGQEAQRALHRRFADAYRLRAAGGLVEQD